MTETGTPQVVRVIVEFHDGYIVKVEPAPGNPSDVIVSDLDTKEKKKFRRSDHGLRALETIYESTEKDEAAATGTKCYMIIGGFKVQVPCS